MSLISHSHLLQELVRFQKQLAAEIEAESLPFQVMEFIRQIMKADNALLVGVDGKLIGEWWVHNPGWRIKSFSMDVVTKALESDEGYWRSSLSENPSSSQIEAQIHSCLAARLEIGKEIVGAVYCDLRSGSRLFSDEDGKCLKTMADCLSIYISYYNVHRKINDVPQSQSEDVKTRASADSILIGETDRMQECKAEISAAAPLVAPVLLLGPTGSGKEVAARLLHDLSGRRGRFVAVNCSAITHELFESEMFGHEKGAFSGAVKSRSGLILAADGGTLFIDEVGDIPLEMQVKLLRFLDNKKVRPVGSDVELGPVDFRLVTATNKNLKIMIAQNKFREDLFYRISSIRLALPELKKRVSDIPLLASHFASPKKLHPDAMNLLLAVSDWPGNVRQLKTVVDNASNLAQGYEISKQTIQKQLEYQDLLKQDPSFKNFHEIKLEWENGKLSDSDLSSLLNSYYKNCGSNWTEVARCIGLSSNAELKSFRNWIWYLQKKKILTAEAESVG